MEERITEVEIKIAHLEQALMEFHDAVYRQQRMLDRLERALEELRERVLAAESPAAAGNPAAEKPPHY